MYPDAIVRDDVVALVIDPERGAVAVGEHGGEHRWRPADVRTRLASIEHEVGPRWVWWTSETALQLVDAGIRPARCWDLGAVHRLLDGGWRSEPARTWAFVNDLDPDRLPLLAPIDLFTAATEIDDAGSDGAIRRDGHLDPALVTGGWRSSADRMATWARLALEVYRRQRELILRLEDRPAATATARSESAAAVLAVELGHDGLPIDVAEAERIVATFIGPRPTDAADERRLADERDDRVLTHLPADLRTGVDLRNPTSVKSLLRRAGIEVDDTRAWRLEQLRNVHPIVEALLAWRKAERVATTFGYRWLDENVGADGRLRGSWTSSDGAAGRMTATAGLHNLPADLRPAVVAEPGHSFVRSDLGQIEPRILAAVSGDVALAAATLDDDMYAPVARRLGVGREIAKVAVLGAMYGQTTGHGAAALRGLEAAYPVAMRYLGDAARAAEAGNDLRTRGGRRVRMSSGRDPDLGERDQRTRAAARGRYGRNAMVQGAAAEFFKTWAVIVRARLPLGAHIVLCLHDELLVHVPSSDAARVATIVDEALQETAVRWAQPELRGDVRFAADTSVIARWSDAT